jgi:hypothetical protein
VDQSNKIKQRTHAERLSLRQRLVLIVLNPLLLQLSTIPRTKAS